MIKNFFYTRFIEPRSRKEDLRRREFILNVFLLSTLVLTGIAMIKNQLSFIYDDATYEGAPIYVLPIVFLFFVSLMALSRAGLARYSAYFLIATYLVMASYTAYNWGIDIPTGLLVFALAIVMSGILIGTRAAFLVTSIIVGTLFFIQYLHSTAFLPNTQWKQYPVEYSDALIFSLILAVITVVSWLSNRELDKSLLRTLASEAALKKERDQLEVKIEERTRELKEAQVEKMLHVYRFAEFGRLASGFFHDLINPLNTVSLNLESLQANDSTNPDRLADNKKLIQRAINGTKRIEEFVQTAQKQVQRQSHKANFLVQQELKQVIHMLEHKVREGGVTIVVKSLPSQQRLYNDPIKFNQLMMNLISNAIDSYHEQKDARAKEVTILFSRDTDTLHISIKDGGSGIAPRNLQHIFEPLFTTKDSNNGIGLGLAITKDIVEKDFKGTIDITSKEGVGSTFTVAIPLAYNTRS